MTGSASPELPGLETPALPSGRMRDEVEAQLAALAAKGLIHAHHRGLCQLARTLADAVDGSAKYGKAYATAQVARELRETLAMLPEPEETTGDAWDELVAAMRDAEIRDDEDAESPH